MRIFFLVTRILPVLAAVIFFHTALAICAPQVPPSALVGVCSAIVYDLDNDAILFEQNPDQRIPPASLTKIMSMFLALDYKKAGLATASSPVSISREAANTGGSRMGLRQQESVPFNKLLMGMAVSSGNDASHAVAEYVGGSADAFIKMMNTRAANLGMRDTHFVNPHGLPAVGQYTTARDMLTLARAYLRAHPDSLDFHNTRTLEHRGYTSWNKNPLLGQYPGADGLKTGWIRASGYNLIFTASKNQKRLLAVIMGAPDIYIRSAEACRLLDAGFQVCQNQAVTVAAALDTLPCDLKRIDPVKTARDAQIGKFRPGNRYVAKLNSKKKLKVSRNSSKQVAKNLTKRKVSPRKSAAVEKSAQKRKSHAARQDKTTFSRS